VFFSVNVYSFCFLTGVSKNPGKRDEKSIDGYFGILI